MLNWAIRSLFFRCSRFILESGRDHRLQERHHGAKFGAQLLDGVLLLSLTRSQKIRTAFFILCDPGFCETAVANLGENLAHLVARLLGDDARSGGIIALLGSIADGVAHVAEASAVNQVNDELELVEAFEIGDLGLVASFRKRFEARFDQFTHAAAEHGLFAKEVGFGLLGKGGFQNASARAAESLSVGEGKRFRRTAGILLDSQERGCSAAFGENFANAMARGFWSDHGDVDRGRRLDRTEADVESVREHKRFAWFEIWLDGVAIELGLLGVRNEDHDDVSPGGGFRRGVDRQAGLFRFGARGAPFVEADADGNSTIPEIQGVCMTLRAVTNDSDLLCLD